LARDLRTDRGIAEATCLRTVAALLPQPMLLGIRYGVTQIDKI